MHNFSTCFGRSFRPSSGVPYCTYSVRYMLYRLFDYMLAVRLRLKCDGTRAEIRFRLSAKRTSPFKSAGGVSSVDYWQASCTHQPAGFVLLVRACVLQSCDAYWLPTTFSCFPFTSPVRPRVPSHFNWTLPSNTQSTNLYNIYLTLYVQSRTPDDGRRDRTKYVKLYSINSKNCTSSLFYYRNNSILRFFM
jgi:hypothetical protein